MKILWDLRLFSLGYADRGVGTYTKMVATRLQERLPDHKMYVIGNRNDVRKHLAIRVDRWIHYRARNWKRDALVLPILSLLINPDVVHLWSTLGPLYQLGGFRPLSGKSIATVYDLGVEYWPEIPFLASRKASRYWRFQKSLAHNYDSFMCISERVRSDLERLFPFSKGRTLTVYPHPGSPHKSDRSREHYFVTMGGAPNKNLDRTLSAFQRVRKKDANVTLVILGDVSCTVSLGDGMPDGVVRDSMDRYEYHLSRCAGLVFCSTREGLGLPPLQAFSFGCPVLASDIEIFREMLGEDALLVDPTSESALAEGMHRLLTHNERWARKAFDGCGRLLLKSVAHERSLDALYRKLMGGA